MTAAERLYGTSRVKGSEQPRKERISFDVAPTEAGDGGRILILDFT